MNDWLQNTALCYAPIVTDVRLHVDIAVTLHAMTPPLEPQNLNQQPRITDSNVTVVHQNEGGQVKLSYLVPLLFVYCE